MGQKTVTEAKLAENQHVRSGVLLSEKVARQLEVYQLEFALTG